MPIIDNQKMACEPCIRGHRSTKCNHANERMMIPVRKPGRPLSICPHPPNNRCSCTSVTAALPRTRRCGGCVSKPGASSSSSSGPASNVKTMPRSPSKRSFSSKSLQLSDGQPQLGQSQFNVSILGRPDMGMPVNPPPSWSNGSAPAAYGGMPMPGQHQQQDGGYILSMQSNEYMPSQASIPAMIPMVGGQFQPEFQLPGQANGGQIYANEQFQPQFSGYSNGMDMSAFGPSLEDFAAGPPASQINGYHNVQFPAQPLPQQQPQPARGSCCGSTPTPATESFSAPIVAAEAPPSSCCAPPPPKRSESSCCGPTVVTAAATKDTASIESAQITPASSRNSMASNAGTASCCSESPTSLSSSFSQHAMLKTESRAGGPIPLSSIPPAPQPGTSTAQQATQDQVYANMVATHRLQQHGTPAWYRYAPQFGTASTPLQQSQWRSSLIVMDGLPATDGSVLGNGNGNGNGNDDSLRRAFGGDGAPGTTTPAYTVVAAPTTADSDGTSHLCSCGDDCNCVGCVAHPYNAATQNAVQAAWQAIDDSSSTSSSTRTAKASTHAATTSTASATGITTFQLANTSSETSSPVQEFTPSDTADDQPLSADDFLFVNYSVAGCIGEDLICPCGDDCQCFGCTLHNPLVST
ncbi:grisea protein [Ophiostoma piceae UAMH 11346]|uniref:Grisea protein n=1 Tax=Ophiostoma piceae (strain UAMH 11346) TaxID=1262450 RepID=S3CQ96_OPHP1|nr:grisea protein [Ophiostoma piceae UAMH 11346]